MEDFVAGFEETVDRHASAADWIKQHFDAPLVVHDDQHTSRLLGVLTGRAAHAQEFCDYVARG